MTDLYRDLVESFYQRSIEINPQPYKRNRKEPWFAFKGDNMPTPRKEKPIPPVAAEPPTFSVAGAAPKKPKPESIRFHVRRLANGAINITSSLTPDKYPSPLMAAAELPAKHRKTVTDYVRRHIPYIDLNTTISSYWGTITAEEWAAALCSAAIKSLSQSTEAECVVNKPPQNVFMAIDDTLYKLSPISMLGTNRALATVRKRALAEAKTAGDKALDEAKTRAEKTIADANAAASAIFVKSQQVQAEINALKASVKSLAPEWLISSGYPIKFSSDGWRVILDAKLYITEFLYECMVGTQRVRRKWAAVRPDASTHSGGGTLYFQYSAAIGDKFSVSNMKTINGVMLPHINNENSCMQPADAPTRLNNADDIYRLTNAVNRCLAKVDLHSMLASPSSWDGRMWWFVPDDLKKLLTQTDWRLALERACRPSEEELADKSLKEVRTEKNIEPVNPDKERKETWTA